MVLAYKEAGAPIGKQRHRCRRWAEVTGGILEVAGFDQFLANLDEAEAAMDDGLQALGTLAETVVLKNKSDLFCMSGADSASIGQAAKLWTSIFLDADLCADKLHDRNAKARDTMVGQFLSGKVDRMVDITVQAGSGTATLRAKPGRGKQKLYWFEIAITAPDDSGSQPCGGISTGIGFASIGASPTVPWAPAAVAVNEGVAIALAREDYGAQPVTGAPAPAATGATTAVGDNLSVPPPTAGAVVPAEADVASRPADEDRSGQTTAGEVAPAVDGAPAPSGNDLQW